MTFRFTVTHHDATTDAAQFSTTCRVRADWPSVAAFQKARATNGRTAIPGGIREEDRNPLFLREGFYVVREITEDGA